MIPAYVLTALVQATTALVWSIFKAHTGAELQRKLFLAVLTGMNKAAIAGSRVGGGTDVFIEISHDQAEMIGDAMALVFERHADNLPEGVERFVKNEVPAMAHRKMVEAARETGRYSMWQWITTEGSCPVCVGKGGNTYSIATDFNPAHIGCDCAPRLLKG